jgi:cell division protein FtsW (lipid II flippase)
MTLAMLLGLILALSALLLLLVRFAAPFSKMWFAGYALGVCGLLGYAIASFMGVQQFGTPKLPVSDQRRVAHLGYYIGENGSFLFGEEGRAKAIPHESLGPGETIELKPAAREAGLISEWNLRFNCRQHPLRANGRCLNILQEQWLNSGDSLEVVFPGKDEQRFFALKWKREPKAGPLALGTDDVYFYSQGIIRGGGRILDGGSDGELEISRRTISDARPLATMLRSNAAELRKRGWLVPAAWWDVLESIAVVREEKGNSKSRVGLLISSGPAKPGRVTMTIGGHRVAVPSRSLVAHLSPGDSLTYGIGQRHSLLLTLPAKSVQDKQWGNVVELRFPSPVVWPLPPDWRHPFLFTSSSDFVPSDGYRVSLGSPLAAFYAKGTVTDGADRLEINDGERSTVYDIDDGRPDRNVRLGDYQQGAVFAFEPVRQAVPYAGRYALLVLAGITLFFLLLNQTEIDPNDNARLDLGWTLLWCLSLTLFTVRLIVAYRASLLPPPDATAAEVQHVFNRALILSYRAFWIVPVLLLVVRWISRRAAQGAGLLAPLADWCSAFWDRIQQSRWAFYVLWLGPIFLYLLAAKLISRDETLGVRVSIGVHLFIVLGIAARASWLVNAASFVERLVFAVLTLCALGGVMGLIGDNGAFVYGFSIAAAALVTVLWFSPDRPLYRVLIFALVAVGPLAFPLLPKLHLVQMRRIVYDRMHGTPLYRIVSLTNTESDLLLAESGSGRRLNMDLLLRNSYQAWQMLAYASRGSHSPEGYGRVRLTNRGMTYATSMSDCAFSSYIISEHGRWGAVFLIAIYVLLAFGMLYAGIYMPADLEHRLIPLVAIGLFFACNSLYMASANTGMAPFTGQNVPFLSFHSLGDLFQVSVLLVLAVLLLSWETASSSDVPLPDQTNVRYAVFGFIIALFLWNGFLSAQLAKLGREDSYLEDFNLKGEVFDAMENNLPQAGRNTSWKLNPRTLRLERQPFGDVSLIEEAYVQQFNERPDKQSRGQGLYYLAERNAPARPSERYYAALDRTYLLLRSPFAADSGWAGSILASGPTEPVVSALGGSFRLTLSEKGPAGAVTLDAVPPRRTTRGVMIRETASGPDLFEIYRKDQDLFIEKKEDSCRLYVEARPVDSNPHQLLPLELIVFEQGRTRRNLVYLGMQQPAVVHTTWINGRNERVFPEATVFPMAASLARSADLAQILKQKPPKRLNLTLDLPLQRDLQARIAGYAASNKTYSLNDPLKTKRLAVTAIDAFSGEVVALGGYPWSDPSDADFDATLADSSPAEQELLARNHNLVNHNVGSTIKPLVFSAVSSQLWPDIDVARLTAYNPPADPSDSGAVHPHRRWDGLPLTGEWDCYSERQSSTAEEFLINSVNFFQVTIGMMGMWLNKSDRNASWIPTNGRGDLNYDGRNYVFDLTKLREVESPFEYEKGVPRPRTESMKQTLLFKGLADNFQFAIADERDRAFANSAQQFLPSLSHDALDEHGRLRNDFLRMVLPEPVIFNPQRYNDIRGDLISFLLGAGPARLNSVRMAESAARVATGLRVVATLEKSPSARLAPQPMPQPVADLQWRYNHLIEPLRKVSEDGTAEALKGFVQPPYTVIYKTGTVNTSPPNASKPRESEYILMVIGERKDQSFIPGRTLAAYLWLEDSKVAEGDSPDNRMRKFDFAKQVIPALIDYLNR